jgi:hypothetical protein
MFSGKAVAYPREVPFSWKGFARDKHFSLLRKIVNYGSKQFCRIGPKCFSWIGIDEFKDEITEMDKQTITPL